jgi:exopolyphosphatase/guanosine-5'-triphosphate,3'-diphosphate pyrophosphatase
MPDTRRAVIDVGTNSVKLLVADVRDGVVEPVLEDSEQTRLGAGFYETHLLQSAAIAETGRAVATYAARAKELGAVSTRVIATSAARDAKNPGDLISAIEKTSGLKVEIISGEQEADWAFQGVATDPQLAAQPLLLMDAGGGSTEFVVGQGEQKYFARSFPLGTVRLLEKMQPSDPPTLQQRAACRQWVKEFLTRQVAPELSRVLKRAPAQLVGTGGTATILGRMEAQLDNFDRDRIEAVRLTRTRMREWTDRLWSLPLIERRKTVGLPPKRADVILMGLMIYEGTMEVFGLDVLRITTRGLRFAVVLNG